MHQNEELLISDLWIFPNLMHTICVILPLLGWTAIHEASNGGFTDVILELLKAGADVNSRSLCGVLPIHDAVCGNYLEVYFSFM